MKATKAQLEYRAKFLGLINLNSAMLDAAHRQNAPASVCRIAARGLLNALAAAEGR
jgi:hypothetical protein